MDIDAITTLIGNNGFPIVMCLILAYYINTTQKSLTTAINELKNCLGELKQQINDIRSDWRNEDK